MQPARRKSVFRETGLLDGDSVPLSQAPRRERPQSVRFRSRDEVHFVDSYDEPDLLDDALDDETGSSRSEIQTARRLTSSSNQSPLPTGSHSMMYRFVAALLLLTAIVPFLQSSPLLRHTSVIPQGVEGGVIPAEARARTEVNFDKRDDSPTDVCFRWAQQSAIVNGTLYLYGGQSTTEPTTGIAVPENTWNNDFLTLDLTKTWPIGGPSLTGLPQPSGPPNVSEGTLWSSRDSLYLYGGEYSSWPPVSPAPFALWEYNIPSQSWIEHNNPQTSSGVNAPSNDQPVQNAAEGASANVPSLGRGFYFGGHQDAFTTAGWSVQIAREYLESLLEYTFPGYSNQNVTTLSNGQEAGSDGVYRNITEGGVQSAAGFSARADGLLIYVPGFGAEGILLALAGGTNTTYTQMNVINVYDIATSVWYTQSTSGPVPNIRVNPCAVVASAPDGSSSNIYMFGGQNLIPFGNQTEYNDMWILTLPAFTWIQVDQSGQSVPYGRSGHTCNVWNGQMVMVGGRVSDQLSCDSPGIYVFDLSNLQWVQQYTALSPGPDTTSSGPSPTTSGSSSSSSTSDFNSTGVKNPFNQQPAQIVNSTNPGGLEGSYGYQVPDVVISIIGGKATGGATVTKPIVTATAGPLATGSAVTYTVTQSNGATITETARPDGTPEPSSHHGPNIAAIVVGSVCGVLFIVICYLLFCLFIYRKQLRLYQQHVEMSQRQARGEKLPAVPGLWTSDSAKSSSDRRRGEAGNPFLSAGETISQSGSNPTNAPSGHASSSQTRPAGASGYQSVRRDSDQSSTQGLMEGQEPTFVGVMLNPRRSLRVINRD